MIYDVNAASDLKLWRQLRPAVSKVILRQQEKVWFSDYRYIAAFL